MKFAIYCWVPNLEEPDYSASLGRQTSNCVEFGLARSWVSGGVYFDRGLRAEPLETGGGISNLIADSGHLCFDVVVAANLFTFGRYAATCERVISALQAAKLSVSTAAEGDILTSRVDFRRPTFPLAVPSPKAIESWIDVADVMLRDALAKRKPGEAG